MQEHFLSDEKSALRALPPGLFPCYREGRRKVGRDCYVTVEGAYYDVPEQYMGRHVWVRWDSRMVRVLSSSIELICSHTRIAAGKFTSVLGADGRRGTFEESVAYWRKRCSLIGTGAGGWADGVIANRDQMAVRIMQGLTSLTGKYSKEQIEKACVKAALHGQYRLSDLRSWISSPQSQESFNFMESHEIIREPESYDGHIGTQGLFDVVAELLEDDLMVRHQKIMTLYLKCDLLIIDDMGTKQLPPKSGYYLFEIVMRRYEVKSTMMTVEPTPRRMGQANRRRTRRHGYPRPIPSPRPNHQDQR